MNGPLMRLAGSTRASALQVLASYGVDAEPGELRIVDEGLHPLVGVGSPAVVTSISYTGGVTGGNLLALSVEAVRVLAALMMGAPAPEPGSAEPLTDLELSAADEAMNQMMAAAAAATGEILGQEVDVSTPETTVVEDVATLQPDRAAAHVTSAAFLLAGHECRLVQFVPTAFVLRLDNALEDLREIQAEEERAAAVRATVTGSDHDGIRHSLLATRVRLSAELGRTRIPGVDAAAMPQGTTLTLDRDVEAPIDLYVNGRRFGTAALQLTEHGQWAVLIESIDEQAS